MEFFGNFKVLPSEDIRALADSYRDAEDPLIADYWAFLSDIGLTNQPYNPVRLTASSRHSGNQSQGNLNIESSLRKIATVSTEQSVRAKTFFED